MEPEVRAEEAPKEIPAAEPTRPRERPSPPRRRRRQPPPPDIATVMLRWAVLYLIVISAVWAFLGASE